MSRLTLQGIQSDAIEVTIAPRNGRWEQKNHHDEADKLAELLRAVLPVSTYVRLVESLKAAGGNRTPLPKFER